MKYGVYRKSQLYKIISICYEDGYDITREALDALNDLIDEILCDE